MSTDFQKGCRYICKNALRTKKRALKKECVRANRRASKKLEDAPPWKFYCGDIF